MFRQTIGKRINKIVKKPSKIHLYQGSPGPGQHHLPRGASTSCWAVALCYDALALAIFLDKIPLPFNYPKGFLFSLSGVGIMIVPIAYKVGLGQEISFAGRPREDQRSRVISRLASWNSVGEQGEAYAQLLAAQLADSRYRGTIEGIGTSSESIARSVVMFSMSPYLVCGSAIGFDSLMKSSSFRHGWAIDCSVVLLFLAFCFIQFGLAGVAFQLALATGRYQRTRQLALQIRAQCEQVDMESTAKTEKIAEDLKVPWVIERTLSNLPKEEKQEQHSDGRVELEWWIEQILTQEHNTEEQAKERMEVVIRPILDLVQW